MICLSEKNRSGLWLGTTLFIRRISSSHLPLRCKILQTFLAFVLSVKLKHVFRSQNNRNMLVLFLIFSPVTSCKQQTTQNHAIHQIYPDTIHRLPHRSSSVNGLSSSFTSPRIITSGHVVDILMWESQKP